MRKRGRPKGSKTRGKAKGYYQVSHIYADSRGRLFVKKRTYETQPARSLWHQRRWKIEQARRARESRKRRKRIYFPRMRDRQGRFRK